LVDDRLLLGRRVVVAISRKARYQWTLKNGRSRCSAEGCPALPSRLLAQCLPQRPRRPSWQRLFCANRFFCWYSWVGSNHRPPVPQTRCFLLSERPVSARQRLAAWIVTGRNTDHSKPLPLHLRLPPPLTRWPLPGRPALSRHTQGTPFGDDGHYHQGRGPAA
jgi:hypothetical protein